MIHDEKLKHNFLLIHLERSYGTVQRSFDLPVHVDAEHIDQSYKVGVLDLKVKKTGAPGKASA
ncbi:MAG: Hsp20 family protein [Chitinivibrionales bacterium]|nr:Hsp20 family protein [Chitinivibrionales bacterium]